MSAPPARNLGAERATKTGGQRTGTGQHRAGQSARMPECDQGLHRLTRAFKKIFFFYVLSVCLSLQTAGSVVIITAPDTWLCYYINLLLTALQVHLVLMIPIGFSHRQARLFRMAEGAESAHRLALSISLSHPMAALLHPGPGPRTRRHDKSLRIFLPMQPCS